MTRTQTLDCKSLLAMVLLMLVTSTSSYSSSETPLTGGGTETGVVDAGAGGAAEGFGTSGGGTGGCTSNTLISNLCSLKKILWQFLSIKNGTVAVSSNNVSVYQRALTKMNTSFIYFTKSYLSTTYQTPSPYIWSLQNRPLCIIIPLTFHSAT